MAAAEVLRVRSPDGTRIGCEVLADGHAAMDADPELFVEICAEWLRPD